MTAYIIRRLLLIVPTLLGIMVINFIVIQAAPGGPIEQLIARYSGTGVDVTARISGSDRTETLSQDRPGPARDGGTSKYRGAQGLDPDFIRELEVMYGFDKPAHERFLKMLGDYATFDFGNSFFRDQRVVDLVLDKMPVSISLGLWTTLLVYLISIPLGVAKAVRDGSRFDLWTSGVVVIGNAIPSFLFAILLIVLFAGGRYFDWFPLRGLTSIDWDSLAPVDQVIDYFWHLALPILSMVIGGFAGLTLLTKNSFLEEINKQYVVTARAKGLTKQRILYGHVFRNAMLLVIAGFPAAFLSVFFTGVLMIEIIFSLDGLGRLGYEATLARDYPLIFGSLYVFTLIGLFMTLVRDLMYAWIDPRINFERVEV